MRVTLFIERYITGVIRVNDVPNTRTLVNCGWTVEPKSTGSGRRGRGLCEMILAVLFMSAERGMLEMGDARACHRLRYIVSKENWLVVGIICRRRS